MIGRESYGCSAMLRGVIECSRAGSTAGSVAENLQRRFRQ